LRSRRLRVDTTATEADIRYPTDSGLCAHAVSRLGRAVSKVKSAGLATRTRFRNRRRKAGKIIRKVSHALSGGPRDRRAAIDKLTGEVHRLVVATAREVAAVLRNARRALRTGHPKGERQVRQLEREMALAQRFIEQTALRLTGERVIADRLISLSDPDARPIRRGKPQQPTEFGYKVSIADTPEGFVVSHQVYRGNPADAQTLEAAIGGAQDIGMRVGSVFADRGYGDVVGDNALAACGITDSVIPRRGIAHPKQHTRAWRRRYRWRAGAEGRISALKRGNGLRRTRLKGYRGAQIWTGFGVLTSNIDRFVALA
jgi:IS5 family transposase